ncbi:hypothetical protein BKP64_06385 [Marinobacter salinus]|uniref:Uncharacterized protein n=1 Tax=Marinobacter salinus TaxID=1874317 RepID=A0A1D9GKB5_9GAMM|nr:hypothetical protein [Marinobacter salinus]AOY87830.1 hypothetical protein BKP64_06385 [Marinobacter salinus]
MTANNLRRSKHEVIHQQLEKGGFRGPINAKCVECIYDPEAKGTWRQQVQACTSKGCPLFPVRPTPIKVISE